MKKGFTLIELLAVIVMLAIITLIAAPILIHIINDSKESSDEESLKLYQDTVQKVITRKQLNNPNFKPDNCKIQSNGKLECFKGTTSLGIVEMNMKGEKPSSGTVIIEGNGIKYENVVFNGKIYYEKKYPIYSIGDKLVYKGNIWYVIDNSSKKQDYVTLIKETVLTNSELGQYAFSSTSNTMEYFWNETCHNNNHGYEEADKTNCNGHNDYDGSKIKELLENTYIDTLEESDLKEIDGYKIRLITKEELQNNLGYVGNDTSDSTPTFIYQNYGNMSNGVYGYWTMSSAWAIIYVNNKGVLSQLSLADNRGFNGVRPVINLLKSAIPNQS